MLDNPIYAPTGQGRDINFLNLEYFFNLIYQIFNNIYFFFTGLNLPGNSGGVSPGISLGTSLGLSFDDFLLILKNILQILAVFLIAGIVYCIIRIHEIRKAEKEKLKIIEIRDSGEKIRNERWAVVQNHLDSESEADWKFAVIEADNILDELVKKMGYDGQDLGERLKVVEPSDFQSLQSAWEAHKVRNQIVHESSGFKLTYAEAKRVVGLYEQVFREFEYL